MKSTVLIIVYLLLYIIVYVLIQKKFQFKNVIAQLLLAVGLFIAFEAGYALIRTARQSIAGISNETMFSHFELDSILPSALNPADTGFSEHMGQSKSRLERKVFYIPRSAIDSPSNTVLICCYGGSSTYCIGVRSEKSWPSVLQKRLTDSGFHIVVHNHAISGHNIKDAVTNLQHYPCKDAHSYKKRVQVHFHGWNDIRLVNLPLVDSDDALFTKATTWHLETNKLMTGLLPITPKSELYNFYYFRAANTVAFKDQLGIIKKTYIINNLYKKMLDKKLNNLVRTYQDNMVKVADSNKAKTQNLRHNFNAYFTKYIHEIEVLSAHNGHNDAVLFIPQILNYPMLETSKEQTFSYWMPGVSEQFACLLTKDINALLKNVYPQHGTFYNQIQSGWASEDFLDNGHFNEKGNIKFVDKIFTEVSGLVR